MTVSEYAGIILSMAACPAGAGKGLMLTDGYKYVMKYSRWIYKRPPQPVLKFLQRPETAHKKTTEKQR